MNIVYVSSACLKKNKKEIDKTSKIKLENNIINFHNSIIEGLSRKKEIEKIYSLIGLPISLSTNTKIVWKNKKECIKKVKYIQVGFVNIPIIKQIIVCKNICKQFKKIILQNKEKDIVVIYDASFVSVMPKLKKMTKRYHIKTIGIFADIYDYMYDVERKSNKLSIIKKIYRKKMRKVYNTTDAYVFLTKFMDKIINKTNKPYIIMEGIVSLEKNINNIKSEEKIIKQNKVIYAGGLYEEYGIKNLVEAFKLIKNDNYELHIYGHGNLESYIKNIKNNNIKYFGMIDNEIIKKKEKEATLLVNPRFTDKEYTKYSFPSKILEYMCSGTPVLTTDLQGMPDEYKNYVYLMEDETIYGMKKELDKILNIKQNELIRKGIKAKEFIIKNKNCDIQSERILNLIRSITEEKEHEKKYVRNN